MTNTLSAASSATTPNALLQNAVKSPPPATKPSSTGQSPEGPGSDRTSQTRSDTPPTSSQDSTLVTLSEAARARMEGEEAADTLRSGLESAMAEAEALQSALDELEEAFKKLLKTFGLSDEDAAIGAKTGRDAVEEATRTTERVAKQSDFEVTTSQTLVVEAREVSFTLTRESENGEKTTVSASVKSVSISYEETTTVRARQKESDPLILDLDGNGLDLKSVDEAGKRFDIDGDGTEDQTAWVGGEDAFLAMDRDGDGEITSGKELFGDQHGAKDGFAELSKLDSNADGAIDNQDEAWGKLLLLKADGSTQTLEDAGITRITLDAVVPVDTRIGDAGRLTGLSSFERTDGRSGSVGNLLLDVKV